jgi:hypothetical protein
MRRGALIALLAVIGCNTVLGNEKGTPYAGGGEVSGRGKNGQCLLGFADCNGDPRDGCEADLSEPEHCGECDAHCRGDTPLCASAKGHYVCASGCPAEAPLLCGYQCVDRMTSVTHCGTCNHACPSAAPHEGVCKDGQCQSSCEAGFHACPRSEECARDDDPKACGPTCAACPDGPHGAAACDNDACTFACAAGFANCDRLLANGCEATLLDDPKNCGACGKSCGGTRCVGGLCVPVP